MNNSSVSYSFDSISPSSLKALSALTFSHTGTRRLCLHKSPDSLLHVMLVELKSLCTYPFHAHNHSSEFVHLISGDLFISYMDSSIPIHLSSTSTTSVLTESNRFHKVESGADGAIYLEVILGPFDPSNSSFIS